MAWTRNAVLIPALAFLAVGGVLAGTVQDQERRSVWTGVYSTEQAKRAEGIYAQACAACHGPMLDGGRNGATARQQYLQRELERDDAR